MSTKENRQESFGMHQLSFLDKIIYQLRIHSIKKYCYCAWQNIMDVWSGYNATFLSYVQETYKPKSCYAFDLVLNKESLSAQWINCIEWDLNKPFSTENNFDLIFATAILEHLSNPVWFLKECFNALKSGWRLVLTTPSVWSQPVLEFLAYRLHVISEEEIRDHKEYYDKNKLVSYCIQAWFKQDKIHHEYFELWMNNLVVAYKE